MSLHRRAAKRDQSEAPIFDYLRKAGWSVQPVSIPHGPDAFAAYCGITVAIEAKTGKAKPRPGQVQWAANWRGMYWILRDVEDAAALHQAAQPLRRFTEAKA